MKNAHPVLQVQDSLHLPRLPWSRRIITTEELFVSAR